MDHRKILTIGFFLVLFGMVVPFLMVMKIVESTLLLNFLSYTATVAGLFLGIVGAAYYVRIKRK